MVCYDMIHGTINTIRYDMIQYAVSDNRIHTVCNETIENFHNDIGLNIRQKK